MKSESPANTQTNVAWQDPQGPDSKSIIEQALVGSGLALWDWNIVSGIVRLSREWSLMMGGPNEATETTFSALAETAHLDDREGIRQRILALLKGTAGRYEAEHRVKTLTGRWIWVHSTGSVVTRENTGRALRMVGANLDITERKHAEHALRESEEHFRQAFLQCGVGFHITTLDGRFLQVNEKFCEITGYSKDELLRMSVHETQTEEDAARSREFRQSLQNGGPTSGHRVRQLVRKDKSELWISSGMSLVRDDDGKPLHFMSVIQDITQHTLAERRIEQLATRDSLTGLHNRSMLVDQMDAAIARLKFLLKKSAFIHWHHKLTCIAGAVVLSTK